MIKQCIVLVIVSFLFGCRTDQKRAPSSPSVKSSIAPMPSEALWTTFDAGDGVSVDLPLAGVVTDTADTASFNVGSRTETHAGLGVKIMRHVFDGKMGSALRELTPAGGDAHSTVIAKLYGDARAQGRTVTENFRGAFADDLDARGGIEDDGKNVLRYLFFRRGDDMVMVLATAAREHVDASKPDVDRYFRSLRVSGSAIETSNFSAEKEAR